MNRDEMVKHLSEKFGYSEDQLKNAPDELLGEMCKNHGEGGTPDAAMADDDQSADHPAPPAASMASTSSSTSPMASTSASTSPMASTSIGDPNPPVQNAGESSIGEPNPPVSNAPAGGNAGSPTFDENADPSKMSDEQRREYADHYAAKYRQYANYKHGETPVTSPMASAPASVRSHAEIADFVNREVSKRVDEAMKRIEQSAGARISRVEQFAERRIAAELRATADARFQALVGQGKLLPAHVEALRPTAYLLDAQVMRKFSERGANGKPVTVERTAFEDFFASLEKGPVITSFKEKGKTDSSAVSTDDEKEKAEIAKVEQHFETYREYFPKGSTKESLVEGFKNNRKADKSLTAERFLA